MKSIKVLGTYQGFDDCDIMEIIEVEGGVEFKDLVNGGDLENEFIEGIDLERAVEYGIEIGLWKRGGERVLVDIDWKKWSDFYNNVE